MDNKKKKIIAIIVGIIVIIILLLCLKCCNGKPEPIIEDIDNTEECLAFVDERINKGDEILSELEQWLGSLELESICEPEIAEAFKSFGERLVALDESFDKKNCTSEELQNQYKKWNEYFNTIGDMGEKMIEISRSIELEQKSEVMNQFDELITIHEDIVKLREEVK